MAAARVETKPRRILWYAGLSALLSVLFATTYGGANWLASQRAEWFHFYLETELAIPFVPYWIWIYLSLNLFTLLPLFVLSLGGIRRFATAFALVTVGAASFHILFPAASGWQRPAVVAGYPQFAWLYAIEGPHNLVPSLHVAYTSLTALLVHRPLVYAWAAMLALSTLLVHQHHLLDVATGAALGWGGYRWFARADGSGLWLESAFR